MLMRHETKLFFLMFRETETRTTKLFKGLRFGRGGRNRTVLLFTSCNATTFNRSSRKEKTLSTYTMQREYNMNLHTLHSKLIRQNVEQNLSYSMPKINNSWANDRHILYDISRSPPPPLLSINFTYTT